MQACNNHDLDVDQTRHVSLHSICKELHSVPYRWTESTHCNMPCTYRNCKCVCWPSEWLFRIIPATWQPGHNSNVSLDLTGQQHSLARERQHEITHYKAASKPNTTDELCCSAHSTQSSHRLLRNKSAHHHISTMQSTKQSENTSLVVKQQHAHKPTF